MLYQLCLEASMSRSLNAIKGADRRKQDDTATNLAYDYCWLIGTQRWSGSIFYLPNQVIFSVKVGRTSATSFYK